MFPWCHPRLVGSPECLLKLHCEIELVLCHFESIWVRFQQLHFLCRIFPHCILSIPYLNCTRCPCTWIPICPLYCPCPSGFCPLFGVRTSPPCVHFFGSTPFLICLPSGWLASDLCVHFFGYPPFSGCLQHEIPSVVSGLAIIYYFP